MTNESQLLRWLSAVIITMTTDVQGHKGYSLSARYLYTITILHMNCREESSVFHRAVRAAYVLCILIDFDYEGRFINKYPSIHRSIQLERCYKKL